MEKLTKEQAVVVSAYTGYLVCDFSDMHEEIEQRFGRPVFTHEMGNGAFMDSVRALFKDDFVSLAPVTNAPADLPAVAGKVRRDVGHFGGKS